MRSRPNLELRLQPAAALPGETVSFELTLIGRSATPIDGVLLRLRGIEFRHQGKAMVAHRNVKLLADLGAHHLAEGEHKVLRGTFTVPRGLPPSFVGPVSRIEYSLEARIDIPWWPDRVETWLLEVLPEPSVPQRKPSFVSNAPHGPAGTELAMEVSLQDTEASPGGAIDGAAAVINAEHHRVVGVQAALVSFDRPTRPLWPPERGDSSPPVVICDGPPESGVSYPFRVRVPANAMPNFTGKHTSLVWKLEVRGVVRLGSDSVVSEEIVLHAASDQPLPKREPQRRAPAMGAERRAQSWSEVASRHGLTIDETEKMTGTFGAVALGITVELRDDTLWSVASLEWPPLRLAAQLSERRLFDRLSGPLTLGDEAFDGRFTARARDASQLSALLDAEVRGALSGFERVTLDDEGALLASVGNGYSLEELDAFVTAAVGAARQLDLAIAALPAPRGLEACRDAWAEQAREVGGTFCAGDLSIRDATLRGSRVELLTRFDDEARPVATVARVLLGTTPARPLSPEVERVLASLRAECEGVRLVSGAAEATLPCPLPDPKRATNLWRALQRLEAAVRQ